MGSLYLVVKHLGTEWINWLLGIYLSMGGLATVPKLIIALAKKLLGQARWEQFDRIIFSIHKGSKSEWYPVRAGFSSSPETRILSRNKVGISENAVVILGASWRCTLPPLHFLARWTQIGFPLRYPRSLTLPHGSMHGQTRLVLYWMRASFRIVSVRCLVSCLPCCYISEHE